MVHKQSFGSIGGQDIPLLILSDGVISVELIPYGGAIRAIRVPDREGTIRNICLGYETLEEYQNQDACFGGTIGRCANRIGGARFSIHGREYQLTANEGENQLHGGWVGFHQKLWDYTYDENRVTFCLESGDGEEGYPGNLRVQVTYTLEQGTLDIDFRAVSDQDTVVNLTNHAYFNLAGHDGGEVEDHVLTLRAGHYTPAGPGNIPTGEIVPVAGTPLDLQDGTVLGQRLGDPFLADSRGYDHNFVLDGGDGPAATVYCPRTGIALELYTTQVGMQLYTAGFLTGRKGLDGVIYGPGHALCLEPQYFPDAVHHPAFPSPILAAGQEYHQSIRYRFFTVE